jgi:hypothetical protein
MEKADNLKKVFIGSEASAILLKARLEETGISSLIKNDSSLAYFGTDPVIVDLYIKEADIIKAGPLLAEIKKNIKS